MADNKRSKCQCEKLQKQVKRYESRFSDLVSSYKTIIEEKNVLEETLKTLSSQSCSPPACGVSSSSDINARSEDATGDAVTETPESGELVDRETSSVADLAQTRLLEEKISVLSKALNSVSEGKAKMETAFKNDRKTMIAEQEMALRKVEEEKENTLKQEEEIRKKLCQEQLEREEESKAHSMMLKELQEILAAERSEKDVLKLMLQEKEWSRMSSQQSVIKNESLTEATQSIPAVANVDEDDAEEDETVEADQVHNLSAEQIKVNEMEDILVDQRAQEERRIVELEFKLSELSDVVGNYDRKRQEDQLVIRKLRERLENLELENSLLSSTQSSGTIGLSNKSEKFSANELGYVGSSSHNDSTHQACQEEYKHLLEEFDMYKRKHKERISKDTADETIEYKQRICRLEREIDRLKVYYEEKERTNLKIISGLQIDVTRSKEEFEQRAEDINNECKLTVEQMVVELRKQRGRTMEVIADRDKEIERLQIKLLEYEGSVNDIKSAHNSNNIDTDTSSKREDFSVVNEILVKSPSQKGDGLFYFTQQAAHYDTELYTCRMQILDMESQLRDFEKGEEQLLTQMQALKEEIRTLERNKSRESANLEYLKNVCLQYMLSDSIAVKSQLSLAISTVLMFSPEEMAQIRKRQKSGWW